MLKIYDKKSSLTFPSGNTYAPEELKINSFYRDLFTCDSVIDIDENGITRSYFPLSMVKEQYEITEPDPQKALDIYIEKRAEAEEQAKKEQLDMEKLNARIEGTAAAIEDLATVIFAEPEEIGR